MLDVDKETKLRIHQWLVDEIKKCETEASIILAAVKNRMLYDIQTVDGMESLHEELDHMVNNCRTKSMIEYDANTRQLTVSNIEQLPVSLFE